MRRKTIVKKMAGVFLFSALGQMGSYTKGMGTNGEDIINGNKYMFNFLKKEEPFWEERFQRLADYNSEVGRGIVHTEECSNAMKSLQNEYNDKMIKWAERNNISLIPGKCL